MTARRRAPLGLRPAPVPEGFPGRVSFIKSASKLGEAPHHALPEVCVAGRSNVGKSTLLNTLCNRRQLARASSTPGRTRLINFFNVQDRLALVDLPGYGWAKAPASMRREWGRHIEGYLRDRPQLRLALLLVDIRHAPRPEDGQLLAWFRAVELPCLLVLTKADKVGSSRRAGRAKDIAGALDFPVVDTVLFSAPERLGRDALWGTILAGTAEEPAPPQGLSTLPSSSDQEPVTRSRPRGGVS